VAIVTPVKRTLVSGALAAALSVLSLSACTSAEPAESAPRPSPTAPERTEAVLRQALLSVDDLPDGYELQPEAEEGGATPVARSQDPKCEAFVRLINAETLPGSKASALAAFAGGNEGPFVEQWIEAMGGTAAVSNIQTQLQSSVDDCDEVTVSLPGSGAAEMELTSVEAPAVGTNPVAYRMRAKDGALGGFEITFVHTGVGDTLLTMDFVAIDPSEIDGLMTAAHTKAAKSLQVAAS
jgi:hypothetical protein